MVKSLLLLVLLVCLTGSLAQAQLFGQPGGYPHIDPDHIPPNPYHRHYNRVNQCQLNSPNKSYNLSGAGEDYKTAFEILRLTPTGRKLVDDFIALNSQTPHEFIHLNENSRRQYGFPVKSGAVYMFTEQSRKIFYDPLEDLGLLAVMLAHELTHALDSEVPVKNREENAAYAELRAGKITEAVFQRMLHRNSWIIERRAFNMQDQILSELVQLTPCYLSYIDEHRRQNGLKLFLPTPDDYIIEAYGLPRDIKNE